MVDVFDGNPWWPHVCLHSAMLWCMTDTAGLPVFLSAVGMRGGGVAWGPAGGLPPPPHLTEVIIYNQRDSTIDGGATIDGANVADHCWEPTSHNSERTAVELYGWRSDSVSLSMYQQLCHVCHCGVLKHHSQLHPLKCMLWDMPLGCLFFMLSVLPLWLFLEPWSVMFILLYCVLYLLRAFSVWQGTI